MNNKNKKNTIIVLNILSVVAFFLITKYLNDKSWIDAIVTTVITTLFYYLIMYKLFKLKFPWSKNKN